MYIKKYAINFLKVCVLTNIPNRFHGLYTEFQLIRGGFFNYT